MPFAGAAMHKWTILDQYTVLHDYVNCAGGVRRYFPPEFYSGSIENKINVCHTVRMK